MNNEVHNMHVFDLLIHDLINPRKFNCVAAVNRGISSAFPPNLPNSPRNLSNLPRKTVGPKYKYFAEKRLTQVYDIRE